MSVAGRYIVPAVRLTLAIAAVLGVVGVATYAMVRNHSATATVRFERIAVLARNACRRQRTSLLDVSHAGVLSTARCGDIRSRVVMTRLDLVVP